MSILELETANVQIDQNFEKDFEDLIHGQRAGHMGQYEYDDLSIGLWNEFISKYQHLYYPPVSEPELINKASGLSASLLGNKPITLVSRGPGSKFLAKEGILIKKLLNVVGVVYIDRCEAALRQSESEGKILLPNAWHKTIKGDIFDPMLRYPVEGIELGTSFGLTLCNVESFPVAAQIEDSFKRNMVALSKQMREGSHFISVFDHNQQKKSNEGAYAGQSDFAKNMLTRKTSLDVNNIDFVVKFFSESYTVAHGFRFRDNQKVFTSRGVQSFKKGDVLWFNNSLKIPRNKTVKWIKESNFEYLFPQIIRDSSERLGWHHFVKKGMA